MIKQCPYCGSKEGYYINTHVSGWIRENRRFDGSDIYNTEMWDDSRLNFTHSKTARCLNCDKEINVNIPRQTEVQP